MKHNHLPFSLVIFCFIVWQLFTNSSFAQWSTNPNVNNPICNATLDQLYPKIVSDGSGGAIITWEDLRNGNADVNIYAQRINFSGDVQWNVDGLTVCDATRNQDHPSVASDGSGGVIIAWADFRDVGQLYDIFAQRINSAGNIQWAANGIAICNTTDAQYTPIIESDGAGSAIIVWNDFRDGSANTNMYAQKINSSGDAQWIVNGISLGIIPGEEKNITVVSDGTGGAIITWQDFRNGGGYSDIYAQKINSVGVLQWTSNGVQISDDSSGIYPASVSDGEGGAIITWADRRNGVDYHIYAQRIDSSGVVQWTTNGNAISTSAYSKQIPTIVSDGSGGAIITWYDSRNVGFGFDIYAQKINSSGVVQWTVDGVAVCNATGDQVVPTIESDGTGGAIITWGDKRSGGAYGDIYAQRINSSGVVQWTVDGVAISTASNDQNTPTITNDGAGGAIITWGDKRNPTSYDIYAQQVNTNGNLGVVSDVVDESNTRIDFDLLQNYPNPFNPSTKIKFTISDFGFTTLKVFDILGNEVATLVNEEKPEGTYEVDFNALELSSGIYFYKILAGSFVQMKKMLLMK